MATYKCRDCSHEIILDFCPSECEICGGSKIVLLDSIKPVREVDKLKKVYKKVSNVGASSSVSTSSESISAKKTGETRKADSYTSYPKKSRSSYVPPEIKGWNWGAFLLGIFWCIDNRVWVGFLCLIPYVGFVMTIALGLKGNEWAWKSRSWSSIEQFKARQRGWAIAGIAITTIVVIISLLAGISSS